MPWQSFLNLLPGWSLGLLTSLLIIVFADWWRSSRKREMFETAIRSELDSSLEHLVWYAWKLSVRYNGLDDQTIEWFRLLVKRYQSQQAQRAAITAVPGESRVWEKLNQHLEGIPNDRDARQQRISQFQQRYSRTSPSLRKQSLSVFANGNEAIQHLSTDLQTKLLRVMRHLAYYNELIDESKFFFRATLSDNLSDVNRRIVESNLDGAYETLLSQTKILVSRMDELVRDERLW